MAETFDWMKPSALWQADGLDFLRQDFFRPQLLEFRTDAFMETFLNAAASPKPDALNGLIAAPPAPDAPLKLYQPNHGCFYLTCSSLCCRIPGFPDRQIHLADGESVFFVLRKVVDGAEYAWVDGGQSKTWQPLDGGPKRVLQGEERLPLLHTVGGNGRSILFGYLPVASRETYAVPPAQLAVDGAPDRRIEDLDSRFSSPMTVLENTPTPAFPTEALQTTSVYLLLELWEYFSTYLPDVAEALKQNAAGISTGDRVGAKNALLEFLATQQLGGSLTLAAALHQVANDRDALNQPSGSDAELQNRLTGLGYDPTYSFQGLALDTDTLDKTVLAALPDSVTVPIVLPKLEPRAGALYLLRCVYERPQCDPPIRIVSQPSAQFQLAPFFDPEAPVRPVKIPLPSDVSIAGMRKFKKGVTFMMSDAMRRKMNSIAGNEKSLLTPNPNAPPDNSGADVAFVCSFSIQIIFIVAFVLLLMFVIILNFVFWWIAFFRICLPIPKRLLPGD